MGGQGGGAGGPSFEVTRTLGQDGGELSTTNTTLFVPSGALEKSTKITVTDLDAEDVELLPETTNGVRLAGFPSKFTPHGLTFDQPVDVGLSYPPPADEDTPIVAMKLDNEQDRTWEIVPGAEFEAGTASFKVDGFSIYGCFEDPNGVAEMLYGPGASGTGGSGAGGTGSGGAGSGGETTGGTGGSGGSSGGASGGVGGSGGAIGGNANGYLDTPTFKGYGYTEVGAGASIDTDLYTEPGPNCASGLTGASSEGSASLVYYVNQGTDHIELGPLLVPDAGLRIEVTDATYRSYVVELRGEPGVWCAPLYNEVPGPQFIAWENFDAIYCPGAQTYDPFDPTTDTIVKVALTVPSNNEIEQPFDYCIDELATGLPNGYMDGPSWSGYGWVDWTGAIVDDDLGEELAPNCITGSTDATLSSFASLGYNLDEPPSGGASAVTVQGTGLELDLLVSPTRDLEVRLLNVDTSFCASLPAAETGPVTIPWEDFVDCDTGSQFFPVNAPIDAISVRVLSSGVTDAPFDLCIERLEEDIPIG